MIKTSLVLLVLLVLLVIMPAGYTVHAVEQRSTGIEDQTGMEVTVYNSNIGLVKDRRPIKLQKGIQELKFMDVAA